MNKKGADSREPLSDAFQELESNASTSKALATAASLPLGRVERAEVSKLYYANRPFYELMCSVESVFDQLLSEENVYLFGVFIVDDISHYLSKVDIGLGQLIPGFASEDTEAVLQAIISSYGNIRGKDYARKRNLRHGASNTETTRATLGTIDYLNKVKREARLKKVEEDEVKKAGGENLSSEEIDKMLCNDLRSALKKRGLRTTGIKADLVKRLKNPQPTDAPGRRLLVEEPGDPVIPDEVLYQDKII